MTDKELNKIRLLTPKEAAKKLRIKLDTLYAKAILGEINAIVLRPNVVRFSQQAIRDYRNS